MLALAVNVVRPEVRHFHVGPYLEVSCGREDEDSVHRGRLFQREGALAIALLRCAQDGEYQVWDPG